MSNENIDHLIQYEYEEGKKRYGSIVERIRENLSLDGIDDLIGDPTLAQRSQEEQWGVDYLKSILENTIIAFCLRLNLDVMDIPDIRLGQAGKASYDLSTKTLTLDPTILLQFYSNYVLLLESRVQWSRGKELDLSKYSRSHAEKAAKALVSLVHQLAHEFSHVYDSVHHPDRAARSAQASAQRRVDKNQYYGDEGEVVGQQVSKDVLNDVVIFLDRDEDLTPAVAHAAHEQMTDLEYQIARRKEIGELLKVDADDMAQLGGSREMSD